MCLALAAVLCLHAYAAGDNRWTIGNGGSIVWNVDGRLPHHDHIEMSGEQVSVVYRYGVEEDGSFSMDRSVVWPMLRTIPNDTHASLIEHFDDDFTSGVSVSGKTFGDEQVESIVLDGKLTVHSVLSFGEVDSPVLALTRCYFPSCTRPAVCEKYTLENISGAPVEVKVPACRRVVNTDPAKGTEGSYTLIAATSDITDMTYSLAPGESVSFGASVQGLEFPQVELPVKVEKELAEREAFVSEMASRLVLDCPDPVLNTMFAFAKIRGAESIFRTKGGLMQSPGGETYYAAMWCNDQVEYINPFFPFLGYDKGNESALNCFLHFARYMNPEFHYVPWSIIAEGYDTYGRFDRGDAAMLAYGASRFALGMGDRQTAEALWPLISWSLEYCDRKLDANGVVASDADELELRFPAGDANLCTSSLYYDALRSASFLAGELSLPDSLSKSFLDRAAVLRENMEKFLGAEMSGFHTYRYYEGNDVLRSWICIPLVMNIFDRKDGTVAALLSPELWSENGVYTQAGTDVFWDRATLYALRGIFASGYREEALSHLSEYSGHRLLGEHVPYAVEAWPEGNQRHLSTESALYCRIFTEGIFGIRPDGFRSFTITPQLPEEWDQMSLKNVYVCTDVPFDITVTRRGDGIGVTISAEGKKKVRFNMENGSTASIRMGAGEISVLL